MKNRKKGLFDEVQQSVREVADTVRAEDGIDPRDEAKRRRLERSRERAESGHGTHKQEQLLAQVQMAIESSLQAAPSSILNSLIVQEVVPEGGTFAVVIMLPETETASVLEVTRALEQAGPALRRDVAESITRKVTPTLNFVVLPHGARKVDE